MPPILGPLIGVAQWLLDKAYDRFQRSRDMSVAMFPALAGFADGSRRAFIVVTVRSQRTTPEKVDDVALRLSNGQYLLQAMPHPAFGPPHAVVTPLQPYDAGLLTSGRTLWLRKKLDHNKQALFELRKKPGSSG